MKVFAYIRSGASDFVQEHIEATVNYGYDVLEIGISPKKKSEGRA